MKRKRDGKRDNRKLLRDICENYSWLPIPQLLALDQKLGQTAFSWKRSLSPKLDLCRLLGSKLDVPMHVKSKRDFYRFWFRHLLTASPDLFHAEWERALKNNPLLSKFPKDLSQQTVMDHFDQWFGFPLWNVRLSSKEERAVRAFVDKVHGKHPKNHGPWRLFDDGSVTYVKNELEMDDPDRGPIFDPEEVPHLFENRSLGFEDQSKLDQVRALLSTLYESKQREAMAKFREKCQLEWKDPSFDLGQCVDPMDWTSPKTFIGEGIQGLVYRNNNCPLVFKTYSYSKEEMKRVLLINKILKGHHITPEIYAMWYCPALDARVVLMQFIDGETLDQWHKKNQPSKDREAKVWQRYQAKLALTKKLGVEHGDLHPGNVMIDKQDEPWLIDFGLGSLLKRP